MSTPFVQFPRTSGNYALTENTNLMDCDSSHFQQSVGWWDDDAGSSAVAQSSTVAYFGDYSLRATCNNASSRIGKTTEGSGHVVVTPSVQHTVSVKVYTEESDREAFLEVLGYNNTSYVEVFNAPSSPALTPGEWTTVTGPTFTPDASVDNVRLRLNYRVASTSAAAPNGEFVYIDAACLTLGATADFVPSFNVVGDLDLRGKLSCDTWDIGGGSSGNQYVYGTLASTLLGSDGGWHFSVSSVGALTISYCDGTNLRYEQSALYSTVDGQPTQFKITWDVGTDTVTYYEGADYTQIDTDATVAGAGVIGTTPLYVGTFDAAAIRMFDGDLYWAEVRDGIGGPVVARFDAGDVLAAL